MSPGKVRRQGKDLADEHFSNDEEDDARLGDQRLWRAEAHASSVAARWSRFPTSTKKRSRMPSSTLLMCAAGTPRPFTRSILSRR